MFPTTTGSTHTPCVTDDDADGYRLTTMTVYAVHINREQVYGGDVTQPSTDVTLRYWDVRRGIVGVYEPGLQALGKLMYD